MSTDAAQPLLAGAKEGRTSAPGSLTATQPPRKRRRLRGLLIRLGALAVGLTVAAVVVEIAVTLFMGQQVRFPRHVVEAPWGLRYNEPGSRYQHRSADGTWSFRINKQGMRDDRDFAYAKPAGVKRIITLGDSYTIGYEVENEQTYAQVLERSLSDAGYRVEVLNAGVSGYSTAEALLYLERELLKYDPDVVVISFCTNDLVDNVRAGLFALENGKLVERRKDYVPAGKLGNFLNSNPFFNLLSEHSNAFALLKERLTYIVKRSAVDENEHVLAAAPADANGKVKRNAKDEATAALLVAIYDRMWEVLHARNIPLIIQSIPAESPIDRTKLLDVFPIDLLDVNRPGLYFLPAKRFLEASAGKEQLYWKRSHFHWTPFSHEASGKALAELILKNDLLGSPAP